MEHQGQDHEHDQEEHSEGVIEILPQDHEENNALDAQTLDNLAAFLTRDDNSEPKSEHEHEENINKSEVNEGHDDVPVRKPSSPTSGDRENRSRSRSQERNQKRWVYCCAKCKKNDKKGKTCVCVVPAGQRRVSIHKEGCSACGCIGCSKEDVQLRQDKKVRESVERTENIEIMRNGCCKECMKAFSTIKKACICQVPATVRRKKIPDTGCPVCGCFGCNPEDTLKASTNDGQVPLNIQKRQEHSHHMRPNDRRFDSRSISRSRSRSRSPRSRSFSRSRSRSRSRSPSGEQRELRYDNLDNSYIGGFLKNTFNLYLPLIGFGIPQRTYSYINGKPPSH